ncbi:MAG: hypothetical protein MRZ46_07635 [Oscillospiraceae bacterium]|nr:hypothetical protein [Oscillospiraceae bacterium]MDY3257083.1 hypothetical protein [Ruminococcus callidus]
MTDKNTKKCILTKRIINIITSVILVIIAEIISEKFFDESFIWALTMMIILFIIFIPVRLFIDKKADAYYEQKTKL